MDCDASMLKKLPLVISIGFLVYVALWCVLGELGLFHLIYADCYNDNLQNPQVCEQYHFFFWIVHLMDGHEGFFVGAFTAILALFTYFLNSSTDKLWKAGKDQLAVIKDQIDLARKEFISTHRPRLKVQLIFNDRWQENECPEGIVKVVNFGDTDAIVISFGIDVFPRIGIHEKARFKLIDNPHYEVITPSHSFDFKFKSGNRLPTRDVDARGEIQICMVGRIIYQDKSNIIRATNFFRVYDPITARFIHATEDDRYRDWEYET